MDERLTRGVTLGRAVLHEARKEKVTFIAGSLAYHAFISLLPLLVLLLVAITTLGNDALESGFLALVRALLSPGGRDVAVTELFVSELRSAGESTGLSLIGGAVLLWGTMRIFRSLDTAFSDIYETERANSFLDQLGDAGLVLAVFAAAVTVAGLLERSLPPGTGFTGLALTAGLAATLYPMYYVFPDTDVTVLEVLPGTLFAAGALTALESLFSVYLAASGSSADSGIISGVLVLLTWLYFSGLILLLGAVVNAVLANRSADVSVTPVFDGPAPVHDAEGRDIDREAVAASLIRLETALADDRSITIGAGDATETFPRPRSF
ncbi:MAG: YihY/virulence factor BrkB family protein, partial [Halolamina sp.]